MLSLLISGFVAYASIKKFRVETDSLAGKLRSEQDEKAKKLEQSQKERELQIRGETQASLIAQEELEARFRGEMRDEMSRLRREAQELANELRRSEGENRKLRMRVLELELEVMRLRTELQLQQVASAVTNGGGMGPLPSLTTTRTTTQVRREGLSPTAPAESLEDDPGADPSEAL